MKISSIHNYAKNPFLLALMIVSIVSSSFMSLEAVTPNNNADLSPDDLFSAIYFLEGDLVERVPALKNLKTHTSGEKTSSELNAQRRLSQEVDNIDASFKSRLQRAVNTKDQYSISNTLKEGGELILLASTKILDPSSMGNAPDINQYNLQNTGERQIALTEVKDFYQSFTNGSSNNVEQLGPLLHLASFMLSWVILMETKSHAAEVLGDIEMLRQIIADHSITHEKLVGQLAQL